MNEAPCTYFPISTLTFSANSSGCSKSTFSGNRIGKNCKKTSIRGQDHEI